MTTTSRHIVSAAKKIFELLPGVRSIDHAHAFLAFLYHHRRLPGYKTFNDRWYQVRISELDKPLRRFVTDKEFLKIFVAGVVGDNYNVPTVAVLDCVEDILSFEFPVDWVAKPTHASGYVMFSREHRDGEFRQSLIDWLQIDFYRTTRERNYAGLTPKVIVEPPIFDGRPNDYKFFCYQGYASVIQVDLGRFDEHTRVFFDRNGSELDFSILKPRYAGNYELPENFTEMLDIADTLSKRFSFVRIDLYSDGKDILVGEITNCHGGGTEEFVPKSAEFTNIERFFGEN